MKNFKTLKTGEFYFRSRSIDLATFEEEYINVASCRVFSKICRTIGTLLYIYDDMLASCIYKLLCNIEVFHRLADQNGFRTLAKFISPLNA